MIVNFRFLIAIHVLHWVIRRSVFYRLPREVDRNPTVEPAHILNPLRRNQYLMTEPPVACVDDEVAYGPGFIINEITADMANVAVHGVNEIFLDRMATAQVRIIVSMPRLFVSFTRILRFYPFILRHSDTDVSRHHHVRVHIFAPKPGTSPIVWITIIVEIANLMLSRDRLHGVDVRAVLDLLFGDRCRQ